MLLFAAIVPSPHIKPNSTPRGTPTAPSAISVATASHNPKRFPFGVRRKRTPTFPRYTVRVPTTPALANQTKPKQNMIRHERKVQSEGD